MKKTRGSAPLITCISVIAALLLVSTLTYFQGVTVGAQTAPNIIATAVTGGVDINHPGQLSFWSSIAGLSVPLTASNSFGGATKSVTLKMANNGTHILLLATWSDPTQSKTKNNVIEDEAFPGLFYANSTFAYEDRIVVWWSLDSTVGPPPCMQKAPEGHGEGEALAGTGNLWHWKAARTDSSGASFGQLKYGSGPFKGTPLIPAHSYADNEFINTTGHYQLGYDQYPTATSPGNFTIGYAENNIPYNTFVVSAHGSYDSATHTYSWVAARTLTTSPARHMVQFDQGKTYYFAVALYDGGPIPIPAGVNHPTGWTSYGENEETKSISSWNTMALGALASTSQPTVSQPAGISFEVAAIVSLGLLVVGFAAGMLVISRFARPKRS